ncbi:MAG: repair protein SbcD/Mre11 [Thermoleophilaceae bacterium]|jgi:DNA repair exonuclease SbcCD nuclease subunit|nr:repair protein SbcD/Mre11 [Thermoleophilaceae bacterium]
MKLAHLADTHLGLRQLHYTLDGGRNTREQDIYNAFERAVDKIIELRPDAVVHSGDLFDGFHPSNTAIAVAFDQFKRLEEEGISTVVIAGNHSTPRVAAVDHVFGLLDRLGCVHAVHAQPEVVEIGELAVTAIPHCNDPGQLREWLTDAKPSATHRFNVLVGHLGLDGLGRVGASEAGHIALSGETLEEVAGFTYIALGHLHQFDRPRINAVYAGSLERVTWTDDTRRKGVVEVDLAADPLDERYVTLHPIENRRFLTLPEVNASQTANLTAAIVAAAERDDIAGAIVKLPIRDVPVEIYGAIDRRAIAKAFKLCLHLELDPEFVDATSAGLHSGAPQELRDFLATRVPRGVEPAKFIGRAEAYMTKAAEEIGA